LALFLGLGVRDIAQSNRGLFAEAEYFAEVRIQSVLGAARYEEVTMFFEDAGAQLAMFEPPRGVYLGAYIASDTAVNGDMVRFEQMMGRHSIFKYRLELARDPDLPPGELVSPPGELVPHETIFRHAVRGRTPLFALEYAGAISDDEFAEISRVLARGFGYYFSPAFVQPPKPVRGQDAAAYVARFTVMRDAFRRYAPHVAFVYAVDIADADVAEQFYPGEAADWVGVRALASLSPYRAFKGDMLAAIEQVYHTFQASKPMFVHIGISRQSGHDFIYRPHLAAAEMERVYNALLADFPRVKGIVYLSVDEVRRGAARNTADDFSITDDEVLRAAYREMVSRPDVVAAVAANDTPEDGGVRKRSRHAALRAGGLYYISERTLLDEMGIPRGSLRGRPRTNGGIRFYPAAALVQSNEWSLQAHGAHIVLEPS